MRFTIVLFVLLLARPVIAFMQKRKARPVPVS
jgi:hypothetical protein